jgi:hypothetical protein
MGACQGCRAPLPAQKGRGRRRKWCSESCRRNTLYGEVCIDCGERRYAGGRKRAGRLRCGECNKAYLKRNPAARTHANPQRARRWSDEDIFNAIRSASINGVTTSTSYQSLYDAGANIPSRTLIVKRFGFWGTAVELAGCRTSRNRKPGPYANRIPNEGLLLALDDCATDLGHPPTYHEFNGWAALHAVPSGQTVRNRFGTWLGALRAYERQAALWRTAS